MGNVFIQQPLPQPGEINSFQLGVRLGFKGYHCWGSVYKKFLLKLPFSFITKNCGGGAVAVEQR
jgi:hypothetical protein